MSKTKNKRLSISKQWFKKPLFIIRWILAPLVTLAVLGLITLTGVWYHYNQKLPTESEIRANIHLQLPLRIYSQDKKLIAEFGQYRRRPVKIEDVPKNIINGFIAIEDSRFYQHNGVDFVGVARAIVQALKKGTVKQGASTITMQVARNYFLSRKQELDRKLKEILLANKIEKLFSKDEILELYLNKIFLGNRSYGIGSAAEVYYGTTINKLTLAQSAMIAGLPKAPSAYNPIVRPKRAKKRRDYILQRMLELKFITKAEHDIALKEPLTAKIHHRATSESNAPYVAEMVRNYVIKQYGENVVYSQGMKVYTTIDSAEQKHAVNTLRKHLISYNKRHGYRGAEATIKLADYKNNLNALLTRLKKQKILGGLIPAVVITSNTKKASLITAQGKTIDIPLKKLRWARTYINYYKRGKRIKKASDVLTPGDIVRVSQNDKKEWELTPLPVISGALVSMNPETGALLSIVGGFDYSQSKFNRAIQARRQPGSSFKPFVYAAALAKGYSPASVVNDAPVVISGSSWKPQNYSGKNYGPTRLRLGLKKSRNLVSINLLREIGVNYTRNYVEAFGFSKKTVPPDLTLALGTGSVTPYQMATAYSILANGGFKIAPHFITDINDHLDNTIDHFEPKTICRECLDAPDPKQPDAPLYNPKYHAERLMKPYVNYQINSMLQSVARSGTATRTRILKRNDIGGKTGTTNDQKDAWFSGFTPKKVAVVWIGFDRLQRMGKRETAAQLALPVWIDFMKVALKDIKQQPLKPPKNLVAVSIDDYHGFQSDSNTTRPLIEYLTRAQIPGRIPESFSYQTGELIDNHYIQPVNNPVNTSIIIAQEENYEDNMQPTTNNQQATRTLQIGNDILEIPEQLF